MEVDCEVNTMSSTIINKFDQKVVELIAIYKKIYKCENEPLDGDQIDHLSEMVRGFANVHQGNLDKEEEAEFHEWLTASLIKNLGA